MTCSRSEWMTRARVDRLRPARLLQPQVRVSGEGGDDVEALAVAVDDEDAGRLGRHRLPAHRLQLVGAGQRLQSLPRRVEGVGQLPLRQHARRGRLSARGGARRRRFGGGELEVREVAAHRAAPQTDGAFAVAALEVFDDEHRLRRVVEVDAARESADLDADVQPAVARNLGGGGEALAAVELPRVRGVEGGRVLRRVREARLLRAEVEHLVLVARQEAEGDAEKGARLRGGDIHLNRPVLELHVLQVRERAAREEEAPATEVLFPLHAFAAHRPAVGVEGDRPRRALRPSPNPDPALRRPTRRARARRTRTTPRTNECYFCSWQLPLKVNGEWSIVNGVWQASIHLPFTIHYSPAFLWEFKGERLQAS